MTIKGTARISVGVDVTELSTIDNLSAVFPVVLSLTTSLANGTTNGTQADTLYYDRFSAESGAQTLDLLGTLTSRLTGATISFVDVVAVLVYNEEAAASGKTITVGDATNPWSGAGQMLVQANDRVVVHPQGLFLWVNPDGSAPTAGTGDELKMTPSSSATWWVFILGRSA